MLVRPDADRAGVEDVLAGGLVALTKRLSASSAHVNFLPREQWERLGTFGLLQRTGLQYHWSNDGYRGFDDFLASLSSRKRKANRKERRECAAGGLESRRLTGAAIEERNRKSVVEGERG